MGESFLNLASRDERAPILETPPQNYSSRES